MIGPKIRENLRAHLRAELLESLTTFEESIDSKVSMRVSTIEKALIDQSAIIAALSQRAIEAEQNFQRLIGAVERLCEQKEAASTARVVPIRLSRGNSATLFNGHRRLPVYSPIRVSGRASFRKKRPNRIGIASR